MNVYRTLITEATNALEFGEAARLVQQRIKGGHDDAPGLMYELALKGHEMIARTTDNNAMVTPALDAWKISYAVVSTLATDPD